MTVKNTKKLSKHLNNNDDCLIFIGNISSFFWFPSFSALNRRYVMPPKNDIFITTVVYEDTHKNYPYLNNH